MNKHGFKLINWLIAFSVCLLAFSAQAELFKWKDADGNLIYSDQPPPGKNKADSEVQQEELPQIISVPAPKASSTVRLSPNKQTNNSVRYKELTIIEPQHDTAVRENSGNVKISVRVLPENFAETGGILAIYMDGNEVSRGTETTVQLVNIDRGTHSLKAELLNSAGHVVKATRPTVFHLQRYHN